jgi:molecular chaperone GrpE (heat shock protein)
MKRFNFGLGLLPLVLMTGCVIGTVRGKQAELCSNLALLNRTVAALNQVARDPASPIEALKQAEERVSNAFKEFRNSAKDTVQEAKADDLEKAYKDLEKAYEDLDEKVKDIPDKSTMAQARVSISENLATTESALIQVKSGLRCP